MNDAIANKLLSQTLGWSLTHEVKDHLPKLQLLADYKYDGYQRFGPGIKFIESLALWLSQFDPPDRRTALQLVLDHVIFISEKEISHLVDSAYRDTIVQERIKAVSEELQIPLFRVGKIAASPRYKELGIKSLYLGLSDGARTNELRRAASGSISNGQIWQAYELGDMKSREMIEGLKETLQIQELKSSNALFNMVWLIDDFSGSGNTYIRFDITTGGFKGKIKKVFERLESGDLIDRSHYEVFLLLYVATRQAINHIEYWAEQFTTQFNYRPLQIRVLHVLEEAYSLKSVAEADSSIAALLKNPRYVDMGVVDKHFKVGGTDNPALGFAGCCLPVILSHNTPNNSIYLFCGPEDSKIFRGLFPRISRHKES